jgi:predicted DNA-binding transcriptional regulator AlpA
MSAARKMTGPAVQFDQLNDEVLLRVADIARTAKQPGRPTLLPISRATWFRLVAGGDAPSPIRLSVNAVAWRLGDLRAWLASKGADQ